MMMPHITSADPAYLKGVGAAIVHHKPVIKFDFVHQVTKQDISVYIQPHEALQLIESTAKMLLSHADIAFNYLNN